MLFKIIKMFAEILNFTVKRGFTLITVSFDLCHLTCIEIVNVKHSKAQMSEGFYISLFKA